MIRQNSRFRLCLSGLIASGLFACTQFPELEGTITPQAEAAGYPELVNIRPLLTQADAAQIDAPATQSALEARVASLQARAARLQRGGMTPAERTRLENGLE